MGNLVKSMVVILILAANLYGQIPPGNIELIKIKEGFYPKYEYRGAKIKKTKDIESIVYSLNNNEIKSLIKSGKNMMIMSYIFAGTGGYIGGYSFAKSRSGEDVSPQTWGMSLGLAVTGIFMESHGQNKIAKAVKLYNSIISEN